jgi:galactokinase
MSEKILPDAQYLSIAPGRVNLLGEHVDYNDGPVLPAAIDRAVKLAATPMDQRLVSLEALDLNKSVTFNLDHLEEKEDVHGKPLPSWALYPAGVARTLQQHGLSTPGFKGAFVSNVPIGAGLSSSAAVEVAFAALWQELGSWQADRLTLARYCQEAENRYVGVNCGLMDQFASANGVEGHAVYFDTRSLAFHPVPLPTGAVIVIADSGVRRTLATSAYNERRAACEEAVRLFKTVLPSTRALRDISPAQFEEHANLLPENVRKRAKHVVDECARVDEAMRRLENNDAAGFGELMRAGHVSLRDLYEVSCPELDCLVETAWELPGCLGARLTGAGFGGCTVNLVQEAAADAFISELKSAYLQKTERKAEVYLCRASQGVHVEKL